MQATVGNSRETLDDRLWDILEDYNAASWMGPTITEVMRDIKGLIRDELLSDSAVAANYMHQPIDSESTMSTAYMGLAAALDAVGLTESK